MARLGCPECPTRPGICGRGERCHTPRVATSNPRAKKEHAPITVRAGQFEFLKVNAARGDWRDVYHWLLTLTWSQFAAFLLGFYLLTNLLFAGLYHLGGPGTVAEMPAGSFADAFFFSVETLATVGYGHMYPATLYGHLVATTEILTGMVGVAVLTGLIFVRFSRPTARLGFSRTLVISSFDGQPTLMFRVANLRHQAMANAEFRLMMLRDEPVREEPEPVRRFHTLPLHFERVILFPAALTLRHTIDERSPLHDAFTPEALERGDVRFMASVTCVDVVMSASVQSQGDYNWRDVRLGHRFVEIYHNLSQGRLTVDYGRLHETEPVAAPVSEDREAG